AGRTPACCTARAPHQCRPRAGAVCIRTAKSGCTSRGGRSGRDSCCATSIGPGRTRAFYVESGIPTQTARRPAQGRDLLSTISYRLHREGPSTSLRFARDDGVTGDTEMGARTGSQFLDGLRKTRREIWVDGERIEDVTTHPKLSGGAESLAALFD